MQNKLISKIYKKLTNINQEKILKIAERTDVDKNPELFLSSLFDRDIFSFDSNKVDIKLIQLKKNLKIKKKGKFLYYKLIKYFYSLVCKVFKNLIRVFKRFLFNLLDALLIFNLFFYISVKNLFKGNVNKNDFSKKNKKINIFGICYLKNEALESDKYYYKGIREDINNKSLILSFYQYKSIFKGILDLKHNQFYIIHGDYLYFKDIIDLLKIAFKLFIYDFKLFLSAKISIKLKIIDYWSRINNIVFSIINILVLRNLIANYERVRLVNWGENQLQTKPLIISYLINKYKINNSNIKLYTFIGYPFSCSYYPHYCPSKLELKYGFWGEKIILQDYNSIYDMQFHLDKLGSQLLLEKAKNNFIRYAKDLQNKSSKSKNLVKRKITFFTHATLREFEICFNKFLNYKLKNNLQSNYIFWIRNHPAIMQLEIKKFFKNRIKSYKGINIEIKFINTNEESIEESINNSENCVFGESGYINMALEKNTKVYVVRTSYRYKNPIQINSLLNRINEIVYID